MSVTMPSRPIRIANRRCIHSIQAVRLSNGGKIVPLQRGHELPQPKPESVTRTTAPNTIKPAVASAVASAKGTNNLL